jgi:hypothetical protein
MSVRALNVESMIAISNDWLDPQRERPLLEKIRTAAGLLPALEEAHHALLEMQETPDPTRAAIDRVGRMQADADLRHDRKLRGIHQVLTALSELEDDAATAQAYVALRDLLFPSGLLMTKGTYAAEAGQVMLAHERLGQNPDATGKLKAIPMPGGKTLWAEVTAWLQAGQELAKLDAARNKLEAEANTMPGGRSRAALQKARFRWMAVVNALVANLALDDSVDPHTEARLLGRLLREEGKADRRRAAASDTEETTPPAPPAGSDSPATGGVNGA